MRNKPYHIQGDSKRPIIKKGDFLLDIGEGEYGRITKSFLKEEEFCVGFEYFKGVNDKGEAIFLSGNPDTDGEEPITVHIANLIEPDLEEVKKFVEKKKNEFREAKAWAKLCGLK